MKDRNFCHFGPVFALSAPWQPKKTKFWKNEKKYLDILSFYICVPYVTIVWCMVPEIWSVTDRIFCQFGPFLPFYHPNIPKNQNFEKLKKTPGDIIILHMCTTNENHMVNGSWYIKRDGQIFLSFWTIFSPFTSLKSQKMKLLEKWKNTWIYYDFTQVYQKSWSYDKVFLRYGAWRM